MSLTFKDLKAGDRFFLDGVRHWKLPDGSASLSPGSVGRIDVPPEREVERFPPGTPLFKELGVGEWFHDERTGRRYCKASETTATRAVDGFLYTLPPDREVSRLPDASSIEFTT